MLKGRRRWDLALCWWRAGRSVARWLRAINGLNVEVTDKTGHRLHICLLAVLRGEILVILNVIGCYFDPRPRVLIHIHHSRARLGLI